MANTAVWFQFQRILVQFFHCEPQKLAEFEMVLDITSEIYCGESEASALGTRHALQVLIQYFLYDPGLFPNASVA